MKNKSNKSDGLISIQEMEIEENDKPPLSYPQLSRPWRVAVIANMKGENSLSATEGPGDAGAEFDKPETIQAIQNAIETDGHTTVFLNADATLPYRLQEFCPDICFNIAEGLGGDAREAQVPALLEMLHIPYTASRVLANAVGLDKTMTKRIWHDHGLPTALFQEFVTGQEPLIDGLCFPMFVKPAREGTGMGMDGGSIVYTEDELRCRVTWVINTYRQPALVETYLPGREFTIGVLGRSEAAQYTPLGHIYNSDGFHRFPVLEVDNHNTATPGVYGYKTKTLHPGDAGVPAFICPADVDADLAQELHHLAVQAHLAIGAIDVSRVDFRLDANGRPHLLEINTLPGLTPGFSDLCVIANAEGIAYKDLILEILYLGASRFGMVTPRSTPALVPIRVPEMAAV